jgi:hypothetical protein
MLIKNEPASPMAGPDPYGYYIQSGMTLRDYFAAKAMLALIIANNGIIDVVTGLGNCKDAYQIADNMLKARKVNDEEV